jgi:hypothetical protein
MKWYIKFLILLFLCFNFKSIATAQQYPQTTWAAYDPSGNAVLIGVDLNGNIYTTGRAHEQLATTGYIPQMAPVAMGTDGHWHTLLVDSNGNLETTGGGGTTTNALTFATSGGAAPNSTFNGSAAVTADYHTVGAQPNTGCTSDGDGELYDMLHGWNGWRHL